MTPPAPASAPQARQAPRGRALLSYLPEPCGWAAEDPRLLGHSNKWESRELARQLWLAGFDVDAIDYRDTAFVPPHPYDLVIDIDRNLGRLAPLLPPGALRLLHMTGGYGPFANAAELERLEALRRRRGRALAPRRQVPGLEAVARSLDAADRCSLLGNGATLASYPPDLQARTTLLPATASFLGGNAKGPGERVPATREFLFFAGSGAVHKGLDRVLEALDRLPGVRLHVAAPIGDETDFLQAYQRELTRPEVTLHGVVDPAGPAFHALLRRCFAVLQPSCSEGQSTSVLTCMQAGLLPIVSPECGVDLPPGAGLLLPSCEVSDVEAAMREAQALSDRALDEAIGRAQAAALTGHGRPAFQVRVAAYLAEVLASRDAILAGRGARERLAAPAVSSRTAGQVAGTGTPATTAPPAPEGPRVSVVIPCFRSARFLARALGSVLAQTERDLEVIVVDNASDDGTWELAQQLAAADPRVRLFRNDENVGPVRNWRRGLSEARGRYATLLFSDDWYAPTFLERATALLEAAPDAGLVYSAVDIVDEDEQLRPSRVTRSYQLAGPPLHPSSDYLGPMLERFSYAHPVSPGCALARREDLARWLGAELPDPHGARYLAHGAGPDVWIYLQACLDYPRFGHLAEPLVCFSNSGGNLTFKPGVQLAYRLGLLAFLDERRPPGIDLQQAYLTIWGGLRGDRRRAAVEGRLGLGAWLKLGPAVLGGDLSDAAAEEAALVLAEQAARRPDQVPADASIAFPALAEDPASPYRVTALVSIYRSTVYLRGCLEDLLAQTLHARGELEILCVDTGSPDGDGEIVREFQARSPHIRYVRTEDRRSLYAAWNMGIVAARGRYLTSANTDDRHAPEALEKLADLLDRRPEVDLAYADQVFTRVVNETLATTTSRLRRVWAPWDYRLLRGACMAGPQPVWRRRLHARWGLFDESFHSAGDWEFWLRAGAQARFEKLDEVLGLYYANPGGLENSHPRSAAEAEACRRRYEIGPGEQGGSSWGIHDVTDDGARPAASVILAGAADAEALSLAASSAALQTLRDLELVVVDDGRQGDVPGLLQQLRRRRPDLRTRHVRHRAPGLAAARQAGIAEATGRWLLVLDPQELADPGLLAGLVEALRQAPLAGLAYADLAVGASSPGQPACAFSVEALRAGPAPRTVLYHRNAFAVAGGYLADDPEPELTRRHLLRCAERGLVGQRVEAPLVHPLPRRGPRPLQARVNGGRP